MTKVGEHITIDIIGTTKEYDPSIFEKLIHVTFSLYKRYKINVSELSIFLDTNQFHNW